MQTQIQAIINYLSTKYSRHTIWIFTNYLCQWFHAIQQSAIRSLTTINVTTSNNSYTMSHHCD